MNVLRNVCLTVVLALAGSSVAQGQDSLAERSVTSSASELRTREGMCANALFATGGNGVLSQHRLCLQNGFVNTTFDDPRLGMVVLYTTDGLTRSCTTEWELTLFRVNPDGTERRVRRMVVTERATGEGGSRATFHCDRGFGCAYDGLATMLFRNQPFVPGVYRVLARHSFDTTRQISVTFTITE